MSNVVVSPNTYAGRAYGQYLTNALLMPKGIVDMGLVTPIREQKYKTVLRGIDQSVEFQNPSATFTAQAGAATRDEKVLTLIDYEVMIETNWYAVSKSWEAEQQKAGSLNDYVPPADLETFLLERVLAPKIGIQNEQLYLTGKNAFASFSADYDGLLPTIEADASALKYKVGSNTVNTLSITAIVTGAAGAATVAVTSTANLKVGDKLTIFDTDGNQQIGGVTIDGQTVTVLGINSGTVVTIAEAVTGATAATEGNVQFINVSNVIETLNRFYLTIPEVIKRNPTTRIMIPFHVADAYRIATASVANGSGAYFTQGYFTQDGLIPFLEMNMIAMPYWQANTIACWNPDNVFLAFDLESDDVFAEVKYMYPINLDQVYKTKVRMKSAIGYKYSNEVELLRPASLA
jgi:hypothetical protein